jgi:hypothetical protein
MSAARDRLATKQMGVAQLISRLTCLLLHCAGKKQWVGSNDWQGLPPVKVALGVDSQRLVAWVLERMTR